MRHVCKEAEVFLFQHVIQFTARFAHFLINVTKFDLIPIRTGLFQTTANDPGEEALKAPPPPLYDLENYFVNLHHIIHVHFNRCFRHVPIGIFQKFAISTILQRFQNKK